jgi:hypothetical protein
MGVNRADTPLYSREPDAARTSPFLVLLGYQIKAEKPFKD